MLKFILQTTVGKKYWLLSLNESIFLSRIELLGHIFLLAYDRRKETCFARERTKK